MPRTSEQKVKLLILYDLLCRYTDENHALNTDEIISLLAEKEIAVSRKILLKDISHHNNANKNKGSSSGTDSSGGSDSGGDEKYSDDGSASASEAEGGSE